MSHSRRAACANAPRITPSLREDVRQQAKDRFAALFNNNQWAVRAVETLPPAVVQGKERRVFKIRRAA